MQDTNPLLVGGQADEGKSADEIEHEHESEDRERAEFIEAWKAMYRRKGLDPDACHMDWDAVFEDERGSSAWENFHEAAGVHLLNHIGSAPTHLERRTCVLQTPGATHLSYRVVK